MNLDNCQPPPPPEITLPRLPSISVESQLKCQATKSAKDARRRRLELRRIRSVSRKGKETISIDLPRRPHGEISVVGRRREMDEAVAVELGFVKRGGESYDFYGVFEGRRVARACCQMLHRTLAEIVGEESEKEIEWEEVMVEGLNEVQAKMIENGAAALVGSCAVVGNSEVVVAGSKAVLSRGGVAVRLLDDNYKAKSMREEVKVRVARRSGEEEFLIMGSDGLWDVISDEEACQMARRYCGGDGSGGAEAAAALLAEMAVAQGSKHNVSVILVDLRGAEDCEIPSLSAGSG